MSELKFKTNIKCSGCIAKVTPHLDKLNGIKKWDVDIVNENKILTVEATEASEAQIKAVVADAGFHAELIA